MNNRQRVKVRVADLIEAVRARKAEAVKTHEKAVKEYDRFQAAGGVNSFITEALKSIDPKRVKVETDSRYINHRWTDMPRLIIELPRTFKKVEKPAPLDTSKFDRDLTILGMAADEFISITTDDYERYIR